MTSRRKFIKTAALGAISLTAVPEILNAAGKGTGNDIQMPNKPFGSGSKSELIVPKGNALPITGTFLDEISHDIPHQN